MSSYLSDDDEGENNRRETRSRTMMRNEGTFKELATLHMQITAQLDEFQAILTNPTKTDNTVNMQNLDTEQRVQSFISTLRDERDKLYIAVDELNNNFARGLALISNLTDTARPSAEEVLKKQHEKFEKQTSAMLKQLTNFTTTYANLRTQCATAFPTMEFANITFSIHDLGRRPEENTQNTRIANQQQTQIRRNTGVYNGETRGPPFNDNNEHTGTTRQNATILRHLLKDSIRIPPYNGDPEKWDEFWEMFKTVVHETSEPDIMKFLALKNCVTDRAADLVRRFNGDGSTYNEAIEAMQKTFGNKATRLQAVWEKLQKLPMAKENTRSLRNTYNELAALLASLDRLDQELDTEIMIIEAKKRFPRSVLYELNKISPRFEVMNELMDEVDNIIRTQENLDSTLRSYESIDTTINTTRTLQHSEHTRGSTQNRTHNSYQGYKQQSTRNMYQDSKNQQFKSYCIFCAREGHLSSECRKHATVQAKKAALTQQQRCFQCLKKGHMSTNCRTRTQCRKCNASNHPTILCTRGTSEQSNRAPIKQNRTEDSARPWIPRQSRQNTYKTHIDQDNLLMIARPRILENHTNEKFFINAMIDTGAENSFIRQDVANDLQLTKVKKDIALNLVLFGNEQKTVFADQVQVTLLDQNDEKIESLMLTKEQITTPMLPHKLSSEDKEFLRTQKIRYEEADQNREIHMIIGIDQFFNVLEFEKRQFQLPSGLYLVPTCFGYILCGQQQSDFSTKVNSVHKLEKKSDIEDLWKLENIGINETAEDAEDNQFVLDHFDNTVEINQHGEITVSLPWKTHADKDLGDNYKVALSRFFQQYEATSKNPGIWKAICESIAQQEATGIIEEAPRQTIGPTYYVPYKVVTKLDSNTTKHRIVYDASSHERGKRSLNDCLHPGPVILPECPGMIIRSRMSKYLLTADVEKAFHTIRLNEADRDVTRFIFLRDTRKPPDQNNLRIMRFTRIPFGITSSPFLLGKSIQFYVDKSNASEPIKEAIHNNLYVDNLLLSFEKEQNLLPIYKETKQLFSDMKMNLREYASNSPNIINVPETDRAKTRTQKVLGMQWDTVSDTYEIKKAKVLSKNERITKRKAVSATAETFDPLGLFTPIYAPGKILLQDIWKTGAEWDKELPKEIEEKFKEFQRNVQQTDMKVPRAFKFPQGKFSHELIVFTDASKRMYGAVAYLRSESKDGNVITNFIMSKSRLGTDKGLTIPRGELMSILIGTRLAVYIEKELSQCVTQISICSDSEIALFWVKNNRSYKQFVENRVREIRGHINALEDKGIPTEFRHVNSEDNPADHTTRSLTPETIHTSNWWNGPAWLTQKKENWPENLSFSEFETLSSSAQKTITSETTPVKDTHINSIKRKQMQSIETDSPVINLNWTNNLFKIYRMVACILMFIIKSMAKLDRPAREFRKSIPEFENVITDTHITGAMIQAAESFLIKQHQKEYGIQENQANNMYCINGIVYHKHRRGNDGSFETERPVIKANSRLAYLIINDLHTHHKHAGVNTIMGLFNERFYAPRLRNAVKSALKTCPKCRKMNNKPFPQAPLPHQPKERVERSLPFTYLALDFAGPFLVLKDGSLQTMKAYVALFTCLASRLLHVETVYSLTVDEFMLALRRFFARKGCPRTIISDNATTFTLANKILSKVITLDTVQEKTAEQKIKWHFNAAAAPWQNGCVERLVGVLKKAMRHALGSTSLTRSQFETVTIEAERVVNLRPMTYVNDTDDEHEVIRPIDLVTPKIRMPNIDPTALEDEYHNYTESFREVNKHVDRFWSLWKRDYLTTNKVFENTAQRNAAHSSQQTPEVDEIVLIKDENQPRYKWKTGRVVSLTTGRDGHVRSVHLKSTNGNIITRPIQVLIPLEIRRTGKPDTTVQTRQTVQRKHNGNIHWMKSALCILVSCLCIADAKSVNPYDNVPRNVNLLDRIPKFPLSKTSARPDSLIKQLPEYYDYIDARNKEAPANTISLIRPTHHTYVQKANVGNPKTNMDKREKTGELNRYLLQDSRRYFPINYQEEHRIDEIRELKVDPKPVQRERQQTRQPAWSGVRRTEAEKHIHQYRQNYDTTNTDHRRNKDRQSDISTIGKLYAINNHFSKAPQSQSYIKCIRGGIKLLDTTPATEHPYKICVKTMDTSKSYCLENIIPNKETELPLPIYIALHEHSIRWKLFSDNKFVILTKTCEAQPFCENVQCTFCWENILNPECHPGRVIFLVIFILFATIAGISVLYVICCNRQTITQYGNKLPACFKKCKPRSNNEQEETELRRFDTDYSDTEEQEKERRRTHNRNVSRSSVATERSSRSISSSLGLFKFNIPNFRRNVHFVTVSMLITCFTQTVMTCDNTISITHNETICVNNRCTVRTMQDMFVTAHTKELCINIVLNKTIYDQYIIRPQYTTYQCIKTDVEYTRAVTNMSCMVLTVQRLFTQIVSLCVILIVLSHVITVCVKQVMSMLTVTKCTFRRKFGILNLNSPNELLILRELLSVATEDRLTLRLCVRLLSFSCSSVSE